MPQNYDSTQENRSTGDIIDDKTISDRLLALSVSGSIGLCLFSIADVKELIMEVRDRTKTAMEGRIASLESQLKTVRAEMLQLRSLLAEAQEEFRLLRSKDTATVYDPTLRARIGIALKGRADDPEATA